MAYFSKNLYSPLCIAETRSLDLEAVRELFMTGASSRGQYKALDPESVEQASEESILEGGDGR